MEVNDRRRLVGVDGWANVRLCLASSYATAAAVDGRALCVAGTPTEFIDLLADSQNEC